MMNELTTTNCSCLGFVHVRYLEKLRSGVTAKEYMPLRKHIWPSNVNRDPSSKKRQMVTPVIYKNY